MKNSSLLAIIIPLLVAGVVVAGVFAYKTFTPVPPPQSQLVSAPIPSVIPGISGETSKPTVGFGNLQESNPVADLRQDYDTATADAGINDLQSLSVSAASL